jgi:hypothetical protein
MDALLFFVVLAYTCNMMYVARRIQIPNAFRLLVALVVVLVAAAADGANWWWSWMLFLTLHALMVICELCAAANF